MTTRTLLEAALGLSLGYFIAAVGNALLGDPLGYLGRKALRWLESVGGVNQMPKHEPWYKPRDEDGDDELINRLGNRDPRYDPQRRGGSGRNGGGCAVLIAVAASVATAVVGVADLLV